MWMAFKSEQFLAFSLETPEIAQTVPILFKRKLKQTLHTKQLQKDRFQM